MANKEEASGQADASVPFRVIDGRGQVVLEVTSDSEGNHLRLYDPKGKLAFRISADARGWREAFVFNQEGKVVGRW